MTTNVQLVCFDLGRVLIHICDDWMQACDLAGVRLPAPADPAVFDRVLEIGRQYEIGSIDTHQFDQQVAHVIGLTPRQVEAIGAAWLRGPYPRVERLIEQLADHGIKTACLSNTNERHWQQMTTPGNSNFLPLDRLTYRFASHRIGRAKPDADIYRHVEQATDLVGEAILFFDDTLENVTAAHHRAWRARRIEPNGDPVAQMIRHLAELDVIIDA